MLVLIIPFFFTLLLFIFNLSKKIDWRYSLILSSLFTCSTLVVLTEFLSKLMLFNTQYLFIGWVICTVIVLTYLFIYTKITADNITIKLNYLCNAARNNKLSAFILLFILFSTLVLALVSPPNTFDSMTYHMSRVAHWMQNKSVDFYPTTVFRQLVSAPLSEYIIANFLILYGNDRLANTVQWLSMAGSLIVVSAIACQLGATKSGQIIASIVCATIPMGILQSTSTQNDYLVGFWLLIFAYCVLVWIKQKTFLVAMTIGISLGLAILTKPTAYIYALPFVIYLIVDFIRNFSSKSLLLLVSSLIIFLSLNANHFIRNFEAFGTPIAQSLDSGHYSYENEIFSPNVTISNLTRNIGLHLENNNRFDKLFQYSIERLHKSLNIDINDVRTTWPEYKFKVQGSMRHEDYVGNYYQTLLIFLSLFFYIFFIKKNITSNIYIFLLITSFIIFSTYLRWQPWHSRLQLPLFLLWSPFIGYVFSNLKLYRIKDIIIFEIPFLTKRFPYANDIFHKLQQFNLSSIFIFFMFITCLPAIFNSLTKPVLRESNIFNTARNEQFYFSNSEFKDTYFTISKLVKEINCKKIALIGFHNVWEYPLWNLSPNNVSDPIQIEHISTSYKITNKIIFENNKNFVPCAIVAVQPISNESIIYMNKTFNLIFTSQYLKLFVFHN